MRGFEGVDASFELDVVMGELSLFACVAELLFEELLRAVGEGCHAAADLVGEGAEFVHVCG